MLSPLRNRFGIPGVISVIALVFAMFGGAYAATNDGGQATSSAKAKKGKKGPRGPRGKTGPAGPAGPQGPAGAKGDTGAAGSNGTNGNDGQNGNDGNDGVSVTGVPATVGECPDGGVKYTSASGDDAVCNGEDGTTGFTETLPTEKTETGAWWVQGTGGVSVSPISFPIPLTPADAAGIEIGFTGPGLIAAGDPECEGTPEEPTAPPGYICVYVANTEGGFEVAPNLITPGYGEVEEIGTGGAFVYFEFMFATQHAGGSYAITAP